jgi:hypothetical protein
MSEKGLVRKMPEPGAVVSHDVVFPLDVREAGKIAVVALVQGLQA